MQNKLLKIFKLLFAESVKGCSFDHQIQQTETVMKKGTYVSMYVDGEDIYGTTIEDEANSPTETEKDRTVIRVRWEDGSESIERTDALYQLSK